MLPEGFDPAVGQHGLWAVRLHEEAPATADNTIWLAGAAKELPGFCRIHW